MRTVNRRFRWSVLLLVCIAKAGAAAAAPAAVPAIKPAPPTPSSPAAAAPAVSAGSIAPGAAALTRADLESWLDGFMPYALETGDVGGAVVSVVRNGEVVLAKGYGYSDVAKRTPVDPQTTLFRPGSTSKLFTWTAVMQLVQQGKLNLDHDVNEYLGFKLPAREDGPITLRNILTHTAGFEEQIKELIVSDPKLLMPLETYAAERTPTRIYKAGSTPAYSNYATALAGYIVARVSGQSFDDYIDEHIFKPLGMTHSSFRQPLPAALASSMSSGYAVASQPAKPYEIVVPAPAGSLASSGADMARFMIAHLEGGSYAGGQILNPDTATMMHETPTDMIPPLNRMMLGFYEQNYNGHRVISHGGDTEFFHSYLHLFLDDHVGLFISMNSAGREGAAHLIREGLFEQFARRYFPAPRDERSVDAATAKAHAAAMAGYYDDSRRADRSFMSLLNLIGPVHVVPDAEGHLTVSMFKGLNGAVTKYREVAPWVWVDPDSGWRLAARTEGNRVTRFSVDQVSPFMVFEPSPFSKSATWLQPAVMGALGACTLTALLWPVAAITRRRLRVGTGLAEVDERARVRSRWAAVALTVVSFAWVGIILGGLSNLDFLSRGLDKWLYLLFAISLVVYVGGAIVLLRSAQVTWTARRTWMARLWSAVLALSGLVLLWVAYAYHLMSFSTHY